MAFLNREDRSRAWTERRRLLQPLWNALDDHLTAHLSQGVVLAVSGGPDSRALLESVARWPHRDGGRVVVACVDHRTRAESRAEGDQIVARAYALGLEGFRLEVFPHGDDEASLRDARHGALLRLAQREQLGAVVFAHHASDVAESALMSWLGQGGSGAAMPHARQVGGVWLLRPFLHLTRETLRAALFACGIDDAFQDPDTRSGRSRLRYGLRVLGAKREQTESALASSAVSRRSDEDLLQDLSRPLVATVAEGIAVKPGPRPLMRRALELGLRAISAGIDVRSSSAGLETALDLFGKGMSGTVHLRGASALVGPRGVVLVGQSAVSVAGQAAPTHDDP